MNIVLLLISKLSNLGLTGMLAYGLQGLTSMTNL